MRIRIAVEIVKGTIIGLFAVSPRVLAGDMKAVIVVYDGWGTPTSFVVTGRVLESQGEKAPVAAASEGENMIENLKALESDEIRDADVAVSIAGRTYTATTDKDGIFKVKVKNLSEKERLPTGPVDVRVNVRKPVGVKAAEAVGRIWVHDDKAPFIAIISDVDDTVVKTYVTDKAKMLGATLFMNAKQSAPVEGAAKNYQAALAAGVKGIFYVSGSPQNFYTRIQTFLTTQGFPAGPIVLKNFGEDSITQQEGYKLKRIEALLAAMPSMRVICVGDNGEKDPEIYAEVRKRHPDRVHAIVIRKVASSDARPERFTGMTVIDDKYASADVIARLLPSPAP